MQSKQIFICGSLLLSDSKTLLFEHVTELQCEETIEKVSCGPDFLLAISGMTKIMHVIIALDKQHLYAMGRNAEHTLGIDVPFSASLVKQPHFANKSVTQVACGEKHALVLCENQLYILGTMNVKKQIKNFGPRKLDTMGKRIASMVCGASHCLLLMTDGTVYGFGENNMGMLGLNDLESRSAPTIINIGAPVTSIFSNTPASHSFVITCTVTMRL